MTAVTVPGVVHGMPDTEYHDRPEFSSTGARRILDSPARFRYDREHRVGKRTFDIGHYLHAKVLGTGPQVIAYPDEHLTPSGNPSEKAATREWVDEQRAAGLVPVARADLTLVDAMVEAVLAHQGARRILEQPGAPEVSAFATDPDTGVNVRARFDYLAEDLDAEHAAVDLKTTARTASTRGFGSDAARHGYPIQDAHYRATLEWATGARVPHMVFVVVEKAPPHLVAVHRFDDLTRFVADELAATARRTYADCLAADDWPGYGDDILTPALPGWWGTTDDDPELTL